MNKRNWAKLLIALCIALLVLPLALSVAHDPVHCDIDDCDVCLLIRDVVRMFAFACLCALGIASVIIVAGYCPHRIYYSYAFLPIEKHIRLNN
jgi:hypothetical protein